MSDESPSPCVPSSPISIDKIASALAKAQGAFPVIPKDSEVEVKSKEGKVLYKFKYADLTTIISKTRPALSDNGISFTQGFGRGGVFTLLMHSSGQVLESGFIPCDIPKGSDYKQVAGAVTYLKRISLTAALGVSADEDVDAGPMEANEGNTTSKQSPTRPLTVKLTPKKDAPNVAPGASPRAPATAKMRDQILEKAIDRGISESVLNDLVFKGYGFKGNTLEVWAAKEIYDFLNNEDTTEEHVIQATQRIATRRAAAEIKHGGKV